MCGVVRCHPTALFLVFWHNHSRWGVIIKVLRTHRERHCYIPHWQNGCSTVQHRSALLSERFNSMRCFFTEWGDQMALFPPLTNPNPRITIYQKCLFHDNTGPYYCCWHEEMNPKSNWLVYLFFSSKSYQKFSTRESCWHNINYIIDT